MNFENPKQLKFFPTAVNTVTLVAGAAGYVDIAVSSFTGFDVNRIWLIESICLTPQLLGVRALGEAVDNKFTTTFAVHLLYVSASGHMEFYRNAVNDVAYKMIGYLE